MVKLIYISKIEIMLNISFEIHTYVSMFCMQTD